MSIPHRRLVTTGTLGLAGLVAAGLIAITSPGAMAEDGPESPDVALKRDDDGADVVTTVDDDDDDTNDDTDDGGTNTGTGDSVSGDDATNSRVTSVSRDRDVSRGDLTKDVTRDGGDRTRDWTKNSTNDRSRNDTRA